LNVLSAIAPFIAELARKGRGDEQLVRDGLPVRTRHGADQGAEAEPDPDQVEEGFEETRQQHHPLVPVDVDVAFDQSGGPAAAEPEGQDRCQAEGRQPRTSRRSISWIVR
jgi:hypothetical protein